MRTVSVRRRPHIRGYTAPQRIKHPMRIHLGSIARPSNPNPDLVIPWCGPLQAVEATHLSLGRRGKGVGLRLRRCRLNPLKPQDKGPLFSQTTKWLDVRMLGKETGVLGLRCTCLFSSGLLKSPAHHEKEPKKELDFCPPWYVGGCCALA